jgi:anti-anti-sigma factor
VEDTLNIACRRRGPLTVIDLTGRWTISPSEIEVLDLQALVVRLMAGGSVHIAFNLSGLESLDARGLGEFVHMHNRLRRVGGRLVLVAPNRFVRRMLSVTRLDQMIPLCDAEAEAEVPPLPAAELRYAPSPARAGPSPG